MISRIKPDVKGVVMVAAQLPVVLMKLVEAAVREDAGMIAPAHAHHLPVRVIAEIVSVLQLVNPHAEDARIPVPQEDVRVGAMFTVTIPVGMKPVETVVLEVAV